MHVSLLSLFCYTIDSLSLSHSTEGGYRKHLSLSSFEKSGTVCSRQDTCIAPDRSDLCTFPVVRSDTVIQDEASYLFLSYSVQYVADILGVIRIYLFEMFLCLCFNSIHMSSLSILS